MSYPSISQALPDPFSQNHYVVAPLSGIVHVEKDNVFGTGSTAATAPHFLNAGSLVSPIVIENGVSTGAYLNGSSFTGPAWTLPSALQLVGAWGGTSVNSAISVPGLSSNFTPLRQNNSNSQVNVGDVFGVPVINLSTWPQRFLPGTGGTAVGNSASTGAVVIPGYGTVVTTSGHTITGATGLPANSASMLTFRIDSLPTISSGGAYTLF